MRSIKSQPVAPLPHSPGPFTTTPHAKFGNRFLLLDGSNRPIAVIDGRGNSAWIAKTLSERHQVEVNAERNRRALEGK